MSKSRRSEYYDKTRGLGEGAKRRKRGLDTVKPLCNRAVQMFILNTPPACDPSECIRSLGGVADKAPDPWTHTLQTSGDPNEDNIYSFIQQGVSTNDSQSKKHSTYHEWGLMSYLTETMRRGLT